MERYHKYHGSKLIYLVQGWFILFRLWLYSDVCIKCRKNPPIRNEDGTRHWDCYVCREKLEKWSRQVEYRLDAQAYLDYVLSKSGYDLVEHNRRVSQAIVLARNMESDMLEHADKKGVRFARRQQKNLRKLFKDVPCPACEEVRPGYLIWDNDKGCDLCTEEVERV
jgi:hypothetical protein